MADFTAKDVQALRKSTGAGMMDAKRALEDADGDMDAAAKALREKGLGKAAARSDRENTQGVVTVGEADAAVAMAELKCETDFVAKSDDFKALAQQLADAVAADGDGAADGLATAVDDLKVTLKENIEVGRLVRYETGGDSVVDSYVHRQEERGVNAVLIELEGVDQTVAHDIAVHIAFTRPAYLTRDQVPEDEVAEERAMLEAETRNEGKPEQAIEKIVEGKLGGRFFAERVLLEQKFVRDESQSIADLVGDGSIVRFDQVEIGA